MKILIYEPNNSLSRFLRDYTVSQGLVPKIVTHLPMVQPLLSSGSYEFFLTDYSTDQALINDIIFNVRLRIDLTYIKIFIATPKPDKITLQRMIRLGINGFIKKPFSEDKFKQAFSSWLKKNTYKNNKRVHVRISPAAADRAFVVIPWKTKNAPLRYRIMDISAGGMALETPKNQTPEITNWFQKGKKIPDIEVRIRHFKVVVCGVVIAVLENRICLQFTDTSQDALKYIYRYIADTINS
ncbi:MAG: PilZ domain-containing protein [Fibrobacterota bacterium]